LSKLLITFENRITNSPFPNLNTRLAQILSAVLHPLMMPTLIFAILFYVAPESIQNLEMFNNSARVGMLSLKMGLLILIFLQTFVLPVFTIYALHRFGFVGDLRMETLKDRRLPYLITVMIYTFIATFYTLKLKQLPEIATIITGIAFSVAAVAIISLYWKISAHAVGISGALGALIGIAIKYGNTELFYPILIVVLIMGLLLSARLHLNAHTPLQVIVGSILGIIVSLAVVFFN
jgi:membrane-associated phospholipid phosphatase